MSNRDEIITSLAQQTIEMLDTRIKPNALRKQSSCNRCQSLTNSVLQYMMCKSNADPGLNERRRDLIRSVSGMLNVEKDKAFRDILETLRFRLWDESFRMAPLLKGRSTFDRT